MRTLIALLRFCSPPGSKLAISVGLGTLAVEWWSDPLDKAAGGEFPRMEPLLFGTRGIVPIAYAAFAFALGVTVGMLLRRTLAAMAITLAVFVAVQVAMPQLVRAHLIAPVVSTIAVTVVLTVIVVFAIASSMGFSMLNPWSG